MLTAGQIRAARAYLGWKQEELADKVGVSVPTIKRMEKSGLETMKAGTAETLGRVFAAAGVTFTEDGCICPPKAHGKSKGKKK
jgi:transcriptional regulator with XRE-family HTH domain